MAIVSMGSWTLQLCFSIYVPVQENLYFCIGGFLISNVVLAR